MDANRSESLRRSLHSLAEACAATMRLLEQSLELISDAQRPEKPVPTGQASDDGRPVVDRARFLVAYKGRSCFLANTLPFRFLECLARTPNKYVTHEKLIDDVWDGNRRSEEAVRSVVKTLRQKLRENGLADLADAIDGCVSGHYALRVPT